MSTITTRNKDLRMLGRDTKYRVRVALLIPGLLVIALALIASPLRRPDGWLLPLGWALVVVGVALLISAVAWRTRWQRFAGLLALALVGQACALQLLDAPPFSVYQHYFSWNQDLLSYRNVLSSAQGLFLSGLLGQTIIILVAARAVWPKLKAHISRLLSLRKAILLLAFLMFSGVLFSQSALRYGVESALTAWISVISALNLILVVAAIPAEAIESLRRRFGFDSDGITFTSRLERILPWLIAGWVTATAAIIAWFVFEGVPHIPDDVSYLFQAKYFSTGRLYLPAPPDAASFPISHTVNDGAKWFAYGFPGWPAVLALGVIIGTPWLVNPILGGITILLAHALLGRLYGQRIAYAAIALLAVSPWFIFMSASHMAHPVSVVWTLVALLAVEKERASGRGLWAAVVGICLGFLFLTRPLEGVLVGSAVGLWSLGVGGTRLKLRALAGLVLTGLLVGGLIFPYSLILTGRATYTPHMKYTDETWYPGADTPGFGPEKGNLGWPHYDPLPGHGPVDVVINANKNFYMSNFELFGWSFGSLSFLALGLLLGSRRRADWIFLAVAFAVIAGHVFYWSPGGPDFGARYWYQLLIPFIVLTVRGVQIIRQQLIERGAAKLTASRVTAFVAIASLVAFINVVPWRSLDKYLRYRGMSADVDRLARTHGFGNSLVLIQPQHPEDYALAFVFNPPTLQSPGTIYAVDAGAAHREALQHHFPGRPVWLIGRYPTPEDPVRVLAGPLYPEARTRVSGDMGRESYPKARPQ